MNNDLVNYIKNNYPVYSRESITQQLLQTGLSLEVIEQTWQFAEPEKEKQRYYLQPAFWLTVFGVVFLTPLGLFALLTSVAQNTTRTFTFLFSFLITPSLYVGLYKAGIEIYPYRQAFGKGFIKGSAARLYS